MKARAVLASSRCWCVPSNVRSVRNPPPVTASWKCRSSSSAAPQVPVRPTGGETPQARAGAAGKTAARTQPATAIRISRTIERAPSRSGKRMPPGATSSRPRCFPRRVRPSPLLCLLALAGASAPPPAPAAPPPIVAPKAEEFPRSSISAILLHREELALTAAQVDALSRRDDALAKEDKALRARLDAGPSSTTSSSPSPSGMGGRHGRRGGQRPQPAAHGPDARASSTTTTPGPISRSRSRSSPRPSVRGHGRSPRPTARRCTTGSIRPPAGAERTRADTRLDICGHVVAADRKAAAAT